MKPYSTSPPRLLVTAFAVLGLASCVVPGPYNNGRYGSRGYSSYNSGIGVYSSLPPGYSGNAYYHGNRYYSGGRYETGSFNYQGRRYDNRYQHSDGSYLYGGQHQHYPGSNSSPRHISHDSNHSSRWLGNGSFWRP
jgi:hypothetical protein